MNPELDRGPAPPNLNSKLKSNVNSKRGTNSREIQNLQWPEDEIRMAPIKSGIGKSILAAPSVQISDIESVDVLRHPRIPKK